MARMKTGQPVAPGRKPKGILIVIEGMDGSGKSTLVSSLGESLIASQVLVHTTREPTRDRFGMMLRERQDKGERFTPLEELWLFMLDRAEHGRKLRPHLANGEVVISDRYWHSTWVYQIPLIATGEEQVARRAMLVQDAQRVVPTPDLLIILDLDVAAAQDRILKSRGNLDAFETAELLAQYREGYQQLAQDHGGVVLDANRPIDSLVSEVQDRVLALRGRSLTSL